MASINTPAEHSPLLMNQKAPVSVQPSATWRATVYNWVEGAFDSWFEYSILALIFLNVLAFVIGTIPVGKGVPCKHDCVTINDRWANPLEIFEAVSVAIFTIEYILRLWACVEMKQYAKLGPVLGRLRYALTFFCLIDLISILPFYVTLCIPSIPDTDFTTALRGFRLIRILKADKYINAFSLLGKVFQENSTLLIATMFYAFLCLLVFSTLLYFTERHSGYESAEYFQSIPQAMWPTTLMLTGEFPISDLTPLGQLIGCIIAVVAVAVFAVPTAVLGSGFVRAIQEAEQKEFTVEVG